MNPRWKILAPVLVILFPVVFWLVLVRGHNTYKKLPVVAPFEISQAGDTIYHTIPPFRFQNQDGNIVTEKDLDDKVYVANFFFATCKTVCPQMNEQVHRVQEAFKNVKDFQIVSFTVDPENDNVQSLSSYSDKMHADRTKWWFLTGGKDSIYDLARDGFLVPAAIGNAGDFFHSQDLLLIDKEKRMRGIYDGTQQLAVDTLIDEIKVLMKEYEK